MALVTPTKKAEPQAPQADPKGGAGPILPFTQSAHEHTEQFFDVPVVPGANQQPLGPYDIPAYGYLRNILLEVSITAAGAIGTGVLHEDYPWNLFSNIALSDVNGGAVFGPMDGYAAYQANVANAGSGNPPRIAPNFSAAYTTASFYIRVPLEVSHSTGLGSLANQMSNANYKLNLTVSTLAGLFSSVGTATANTYRIRGYIEAWSPPGDHDMLGRPQMGAPPAIGTSQAWSSYTVPLVAGDNTIQIRRVGNLIRNIVIITRNATPARANNVMMDPMQEWWDNRLLVAHSQGVQRLLQRERLADDSNVGIDTGVWHFAYAIGDRNQTGDDQPTFWIRTAQSTRLEFKGVSAALGTAQVLINDVIPVETNPAERYEFDSDTRFKPAF